MYWIKDNFNLPMSSYLKIVCHIQYVCVGLMAFDQGDGPIGGASEGVRTSLSKMRWLTCSMGPKQMGIHIHASKVQTK